MAYCSACASEVDLPHTCNYCGKTLCADHRLPENHRCQMQSSSNQRSGHSSTSSSQTDDKYVSFLIGLVALPFFLLWRAGKLTLGLLFSSAGIGLILVIAVGAIATGAVTIPGPVSDTADSVADSVANSTDGFGEPNETDIEQAVHSRINTAREENALAPLADDRRLSEIARAHSTDMATRQYYSHESPDGANFEDRYQEAGYNCRVNTASNRYLEGAENIFKMSYDGQSYTTDEIAERAVAGWLDSPGHRENIMNEHWNNEGIGAAVVERDDGSTEVYITQNFC